jgi:PKD repeat protein
MISNASYLRAFRLMPLENSIKKPIEANWKFKVANKEKRIIQFYDNSVGEITKWHWDFGDGTTSEEQNPVHQYKSSNAWTVVLTIEGIASKTARSKVWEVVTE